MSNTEFRTRFIQIPVAGTLTASCVRCRLEVSGTGDESNTCARIINNMRHHRQGSRCWKRQRAQKQASA